MAEVVVDARDLVALTSVAGLPLVARQLRRLARGGCREVRVLGDPGAIGDVLARRPPPPGMSVTVEDRPPHPGESPLDARAVAGLEPPFIVVDEAGAREAERRLFESLRKGVAHDGVVSFYVMRPLSRLVTRLLLPTRIKPNHVTLVAMACGVAAAVLATGGGYARGAAAGVLLWLGAAIDCVDGELARLRVEGSKLGEWLDAVADDVSTQGLLLGLGIGLWGEGRSALWPALGILGFTVGAVTLSKIYADLSRLGQVIDSAQYPWFFGKASDGLRVGRILSSVSYLFRRDAFVTIVALLLLAGAREAAFLALFGGTLVVGVLLVVHVVITGRGTGARIP